MNNSQIAWGTGLLWMMLTVPVVSAEPAGDVDSARATPAVVADASVMSTAIVEAIDLDSRVVTLRTEDGEVISLGVSEEARNLPQLRVGDQVVVTYQIGLALALSPADAATGIRERVDTVTLDRTALGQKPGGTLRKTVRAKGVVRAIDSQARTVTLQGAEQTVTLGVDKAIDLSNVHVGDQVDAIYQESIALSVEPAPPAASE